MAARALMEGGCRSWAEFTHPPRLSSAYTFGGATLARARFFRFPGPGGAGFARGPVKRPPRRAIGTFPEGARPLAARVALRPHTPRMHIPGRPAGRLLPARDTSLSPTKGPSRSSFHVDLGLSSRAGLPPAVALFLGTIGILIAALPPPRINPARRAHERRYVADPLRPLPLCWAGNLCLSLPSCRAGSI